MNVNKINNYNYNQSFQAKVKLKKPNLAEIRDRLLLSSGAAVTGYCTYYLCSDDYIAHEECASSTISGMGTASMASTALAIKPDLLEKLSENNDEKDIPS